MISKTNQRMRLNNGICLLIALVVMMSGNACKPGHRKQVVPEKKLVELLVDLHLADAIGVSFPLKGIPVDSASLYTAVFNKHHITREQFDSSIAYYSRKPEKLEAIYSRVNDRFSKMNSELSEGQKKAEAEKKQLIWQDNKTYNLPKMGAVNKIEISLPVNKPGFYEVSAKIKLFDDDQTVAPRMTLFFWYDNGTPKGFREYFRNTPITKDEKTATYSATLKLANPQVTHLKGYLLDHSNPDSLFAKHAVVSDISVRFYE